MTDGAWVIILGVYGRIGYLALFGLMALPAVLVGLRGRKYGFGAVETGCALLLCANLVDLIPNSSMVPVLWLLSGALWGRVEQAAVDRVQERRQRLGQKTADGRPAPRAEKRRRPPERKRGLAPQGAKATPS